MAMTPGTYGPFIGRVGALAVALGIGVAIANHPATASADDSSTGSTSKSQSSQSESSHSASPHSESSHSASSHSESSESSPSRAAHGSTNTSETKTSISAGDDTDRTTNRVERDADADSTKKSDSDSHKRRARSSKDSEDVPDTKVSSIDAGERAEPRVAEHEATTQTAPVTASVADKTSATVAPPPTTPTSPAPTAAVFAMVGSARREADAAVTESTISPLATPQQLEAERIATQTVSTLPVALMKVVLRAGFLSAAQQLFPGGPDQANVDALNRAVDEYAMGAAFQQQLLNPLTPSVVTQVTPPHAWFGQTVGGSRILYDNPDTIYRFMPVSASSEYRITGRFSDVSANGLPADTSFSVLEGLSGKTSSILTVDDKFVMDADGNFVITVSTEPANGRPNHLQITPGSTIIAARNTLGDWNSEVPMSLSIDRVSGPPDSLFAQLGGFTFLGSVVNGSPLLTNLVSIVPPLPYVPPLLRGTFAALILMVRGVSEQAKYMALATRDPQTGADRQANVLPQPSSNAEFLANQLQSNGFYQLDDDEALVLTIDPGRAGYFIVPTYNDWTITDDYWNLPTSLNNEQAVRNPDGRTYTVVISKNDPLARNWISTGGLNQGTISIRFQNLQTDPTNENAPRIVDQFVVRTEDLNRYLAPDYFVSADERKEQLALRKAGFDKRWAPYPQV